MRPNLVLGRRDVDPGVIGALAARPDHGVELRRGTVCEAHHPAGSRHLHRRPDTLARGADGGFTSVLRSAVWLALLVDPRKTRPHRAFRGRRGIRAGLARKGLGSRTGQRVRGQGSACETTQAELLPWLPPRMECGSDGRAELRVKHGSGCRARPATLGP